ncbi:MAG: hypothetical protein WB802_09235 [Candidatus Dormiibacterota bacterium]|jgi:threonine/homoserine/homoserine lactone efflux protein
MTAALLGFALAATLLILAPGPDSILVTRNCLRGGRRIGWFTATGTITGLLCWALAAGVPVREFSFPLGAWFAVETAIWLGTVVWLVDRGVGWLSRSRVQRGLERITGLVLIGLGLRLATESR